MRWFFIVQTITNPSRDSQITSKHCASHKRTRSHSCRNQEVKQQGQISLPTFKALMATKGTILICICSLVFQLWDSPEVNDFHCWYWSKPRFSVSLEGKKGGRSNLQIAWGPWQWLLTKFNSAFGYAHFTDTQRSQPGWVFSCDRWRRRVFSRTSQSPKTSSTQEAPSEICPKVDSNQEGRCYPEDSPHELSTSTPTIMP